MNTNKQIIVTLATQILLVSSLNSAQASISNGASSVQAGGDGVSGELFVNIWNQTAQTSYYLDLGTTVDDFLATSTSSKSWNLDQSFIDWAGTTTDALIFNVAGNNTYHSQAEGIYGVLQSRLTGTSAPGNITLNTLGQYGTKIRDRANNLDVASNAYNTNIAENYSLVTTDTKSAAYFNYAFWGKQMGTTGWVGSATVRDGANPDQTLDLFNIHLPCGTPLSTTQAIFDPLDGYLTLDVASAKLKWQSNFAQDVVTDNQGITTISTLAVADTYIASDATTTNYSTCSGMMISANVANRETNTVIAYNTANIKALFDAKYGVGLWDITDASVKFYSSFSIPNVPTKNSLYNVPTPGYFKLSWLSNDGWFEPASSGAVGQSLPSLNWSTQASYLTGVIESVSPDAGFHWEGGNYNIYTSTTDGKISYRCGAVGDITPPECYSQIWALSKTTNLINDIKSGGYVSLVGTPADSQVVYYFDQLGQPNAHPQLIVTAQAIQAPVDTGGNTGTGTTGGTGTGTGGTTGTGTTGGTDTGTGTGGGTTGTGTTGGTDTGTGTGGTTGTGTGGTTTGTGTTGGTDTGTGSGGTTTGGTTSGTGTTGGTDTGTGSTTTPAPVVISCTNQKPTEETIQNQWTIHAQQTLSFYVTAYDCFARAVTIKVSGQPKTSLLTQSLDTSTGKQKAQFTWTPQLTDVEKTYNLKFQAGVKTKQGVKTSVVQKTKFSILPPVFSQSVDPVADTAASKLLVTKAVFHRKNSTLEVQGQIKWKAGVSKVVRAVAIAQWVQIVDASTNAVLSETQANLAGTWKISFTVPAGQVAATQLKAIFKTYNSQSKKVVITK